MRRTHRFCAAFGTALVVTTAAGAQMHHVDAPQRVTRAIGVYEWTGELSKPQASRFVPVSLFIDGHFEDAGLYLARPVPFALQSGDLYTVEHSGEPEGLLDLESAERVVTGKALADDDPAGVWYGFGKFTVESAPKPAPALHRSAHVGVIQSSSEQAGTAGKDAQTDENKPHMSRREPAGTGTTSDGGGTSGDGAGRSSTPATTGGDDTDRPTLARRDPGQDAARRRTAAGGKNGTASVTAVGPQPGDDPDRPTLTHHVAGSEEAQALTGMPVDLHQAVAVSDAVLRDPHPFARPWENTAEKASTQAALAALAKPKVAAYLAENHLVPSADVAPPVAAPESSEGIAANTENGAGAPPKLQRGRPSEYGGPGSTAKPATAAVKAPPATTRTAKASVKAAAPVPLAMHSEEVSGFMLTYGGLPTFVYTAAVPAAARDMKEPAPAGAHPIVYVSVVAQRLPSGDLQVALASVTDSQHLDRTPRFHLIDAVDPDASHRASLLFELRGSGSRQFALYRLVTARAENTFTTASIE